MFISELILKESSTVIEKDPIGYSTEKEDQSTLSLSDLRKTRLTFGQLNKLRIMNDARKIEFAQKIETVNKQYGAAPPDSGM